MYDIRDLANYLSNLIHNSLAQNSQDLRRALFEEQQQTRHEVGLVREEVEALKELLQVQAFENDGKREGAMGQSGSKHHSSETGATPEFERLEVGSELFEEHQALIQQHSELKKTHDVLNEALAESQKNEDESEQRIQALEVQVGRLQGHLTKNATNATEIIDSEVRGKAELIRGKIQSIARRYCVGPTTKLSGKPEQLELLDAEWARMRESIPESSAKYEEDLKVDWIRGQMYLMLERMIFNNPVFGLEEDFEKKLSQLEKLFARENPGIDTGDWRSLTVRYSKSLNMSNENLPKKTAMQMILLFHAWTYATKANYSSNSRGSKYREPRQLVEDLTGLCSQAYALAVLLRQSTDTFNFVSIPQGTQIKSEEAADLEAEEVLGPKGNYVGSKVWMTLFGALLKETPEGGQHYTVKAKVICKASEAQGPAEHGRQKKPLVDV